MEHRFYSTTEVNVGASKVKWSAPSHTSVPNQRRVDQHHPILIPSKLKDTYDTWIDKKNKK